MNSTITILEWCKTRLVLYRILNLIDWTNVQSKKKKFNQNYKSYVI